MINQLHGINLIVASEVTPDVLVTSIGTYSNTKGHFITGFIEVKANEVYTISMLLQRKGYSRVAYYDLDKNFIKRDLFQNQEITQIKPEQDGFIRWSPDVNEATGGYGYGYKIEKGNKATPWTPAPEEPVEPVNPPIDPEPELVSLKIPRYRDKNDYKYLIEDGYVTVKINGEIASDAKNIVVPKYSEFTIEIINNQLNKQFDYNSITFIENKYDGVLGSFIDIDRSPTVKTADKMIFNINPENWDKMITGVSQPLTIKALPYLYFIAKETKPIEDYPFLNIYKVDDKSLNTLAKEVNEKRYKQETDNNGSVSPSYDILGNILDLVRIPYAIQTEPELEYIKLNNEAMESQGNQILNYIQEINLGKIHCYHDTLVNIGYKNIGFNLFVPNFKPIELDVAKVIDRTIEMKLNLDLTTGQGTLNLLMDGIAFHVEQEKISKDIPFKSDSINVNLNDNVLNTKYLNPYLEINVLNPDNTINTQELKQRKINKSSLLYAKSDNIILNSKATYNEQLEIEMLLRKGVYING